MNFHKEGMQHKRNQLPFVEDIDKSTEDPIRPLRLLFISVLDRALRDLESREFHVRRESYQWFNLWENTLPDGISYKDIRDNVDLSIPILDIINRKINYASDKLHRFSKTS